MVREGGARRRLAGACVVMAWASALGACKGPPAFQCSESSECGDGVCQPTGYCSFEDDFCPSGQRYGEAAGDGLSNACVEDGGTETETEGLAEDSTSDGGESSTGPSNPARITGTGGTGDPPCGAIGQACCDAGSGSESCLQGLCDAGTCAECRVSVAAGSDVSCAWRNDGVAACWGSDAFGQLGDGEAMRSGVVELSISVADLAIGSEHVCAAATNGTLWCWGRNGDGQLGTGLGSIGEDATEPVAIPGPDVLRVAAGRGHSCATSEGDLSCFGANTYLQSAPQFANGEPVASPMPLGIPALDVVAGGWHTCVLGPTMEIACWGRNDARQSENSGLLSVPQGIIEGLDPVAAVAAGDRHTCVLTVDGDVDCFGSNAQGQLGVATRFVEEGEPQRVDVPAAEQITAGDRHTCVVVAGGEVWCWGDNADGQVGGDGKSLFAIPTPLDVGPATMVAGGGRHTCAALEDGTVVCWGADDLGQLGPAATAPFECGL